jgi:SAM-dependent methyltransferase
VPTQRKRFRTFCPWTSGANRSNASAAPLPNPDNITASPAMKNWIDFYDSAHPIYVSARHRDLHFALVADHIAAYVPSRDAVVIDYSCGEALSAQRVADACGQLILAEPAANVRARLAARFKGDGKIRVCSLDELAGLPQHAADLVVMNSVAQYITPDELNLAFARIRLLLKPDGRFVLGDVVRRRSNALTDAVALLRFGGKHGFFKDAVRGLLRTAMSDYRKLRTRLGLSRYREAEMIDKLKAAGFSAERAEENLGHNRKRMTFVAVPSR